MNKLKLSAIATQPKYGDDGRWMGAEICANLETESDDPKYLGLHRICMNIEISRDMALAVAVYGFRDDDTDVLMGRVRATLDMLTSKLPGTDRDAGHIYEVIRLKLPRFVNKAACMHFYSQNFRTGEIYECGNKRTVPVCREQ